MWKSYAVCVFGSSLDTWNFSFWPIMHRYPDAKAQIQKSVDEVPSTALSAVRQEPVVTEYVERLLRFCTLVQLLNLCDCNLTAKKKKKKMLVTGKKVLLEPNRQEFQCGVFSRRLWPWL